MMDKKCLYCYDTIPNGGSTNNSEYHRSCSKSIFGKEQPPRLEYTQEQILELAKDVIKSNKTVTGVQPKLSLNQAKIEGDRRATRFTIVGLWGEYILKPQTEHYRSLPEIENLTMNLAQLSKINTVNHGMIRLLSGELAYITKRIDRHKSQKTHMEDMCQITERLTEHKYKGSYEQIAKAIYLYTQNPLLDIINFYEMVLFSFLTGNNDMHLKNFSLIKNKKGSYDLCPAYDLLASALVVEGDDEELALHLNGKKKKIKRHDFVEAMTRSQINPKSIENVFEKFSTMIPVWHDKIDRSFIPEDLKSAYQELIVARFKQIGLS